MLNAFLSHGSRLRAHSSQLTAHAPRFPAHVFLPAPPLHSFVMAGSSLRYDLLLASCSMPYALCSMLYASRVSEINKTSNSLSLNSVGGNISFKPIHNDVL